ncbi:hypothetical protein [Burkholderia multivorans]|uniref:DNA-binding protein n=1 Tax=Burkholderia multivorans TaxID=87883 RepID=A0AB37ASH6_9BURK|nr:hypothetical protein [Burkholderia multivorans]PRE45465.1 hypothetical protein C6P99_19415 [Burkholderia multivorans]PRE52153.1 hypothetical protein C6P97_07630 [Burkholderia multivorans]
MPVAKVYAKSQWEAFGRALDALPEKPDTERGVTVRDAMKEMRARVRAAQARGYTLEQIAEAAKSHGIEITAGALRYGLRAAAKGGASGARAPSGTRAAGPAATSATRAPDNPPRTNPVRRDGGKTVTKQPMPVQGTLGFAIRPDTDDL